jgi:YidC/Oxa1 family membrane protein insertase
MEKRALVAIAASILVLFAFRYYEERRMGGRAARKPPSVTQTSPAPTPAPLSSPKEIPQSIAAEKALESAPISPEDTSATPKTLVVEGDHYRATLDNRGGVLTSWQLKHFKSAKGQVFEMIAADPTGETRSVPGALLLEDPTASKLANRELYAVEYPGAPAVDGVLAAPVTVTLRLKRGDVAIEKRYHFLKENYVVEHSVSGQNGGKPIAGRLAVGEDIGPEYEHLINPSVTLTAVSNQGGKVERDGPPEETEVKRIAGDIRWAGLDMQYFAIIAIPSQPVPYFELQKNPVKTVGLDGKEFARDLVKVTLPVNGDAHFQVYLGPKAQTSLEAVRSADLSDVIDYGMFSFLVRPLLFSLKWIEQYVHNYGYAIIILTLLLTLLLFPFRLKQMVSMKKMQAIQPKVKEIQEKYKRYKKTDPKRAEMNQELMGLYREHNVNPLGGCIPLLLQMPLLFAFYQLLAASIELRQAPFLLWIQDLSVKDPYYVLPVVMGVTMLISQKMTPMAPGTDPTQAKMMLIMPVIFTVMFLNVSSGLNLYFLCSNIFQIGFQKIAERWVGDRPVPHKSRA